MYYEWLSAVRDYEVDAQGIVNNAVYMNYMEHTRHLFLNSVGFNFVELHNRGEDLVLKSASIDFKASLTSGDDFKVTLKMHKQGKLRYVFHQEIIRLSDQKVCTIAENTVVCLINGKLGISLSLESKL